MICKKALLLWTVLIGFQSIARAEATIEEDKDIAYFTIQDLPRQQAWKNPTSVIQQGFETFAALAQKLNLLQWVRHEGTPPLSPEPYNRKKHFGPWINDPTDTACFNTRAQVLIRTSQVPVKFKDNNHCVVDQGSWEDPYSGGVHTVAREIQIDHLVPLKNAFTTGAWQWSPKKRCLYANFTANAFHLLPVDGHENMAKGDSAPDEYLPPKSDYVCQYLQEWLKIKLIWQLEMKQAEAEAIRDAVQRYNCDLKNLSMLDSELSQQRAATSDMQVVCQKMATHLEELSTPELPKATSFQEAARQ